MATLGTDGGEYLQRLAALGISDRYVKQVDGTLHGAGHDHDRP